MPQVNQTHWLTVRIWVFDIHGKPTGLYVEHHDQEAVNRMSPIEKKLLVKLRNSKFPQSLGESDTKEN